MADGRRQRPLSSSIPSVSSLHKSHTPSPSLQSNLGFIDSSQAFAVPATRFTRTPRRPAEQARPSDERYSQRPSSQGHQASGWNNGYIDNDLTPRRPTPTTSRTGNPTPPLSTGSGSNSTQSYPSTVRSADPDFLQPRVITSSKTLWKRFAGEPGSAREESMSSTSARRRTTVDAMPATPEGRSSSEVRRQNSTVFPSLSPIRLQSLTATRGPPPSSFRARRSDAHEKEIDQIRSESRAGISRRQDDSDNSSDDLANGQRHGAERSPPVSQHMSGSRRDEINRSYGRSQIPLRRESTPGTGSTGESLSDYHSIASERPLHPSARLQDDVPHSRQPSSSNDTVLGAYRRPSTSMGRHTNDSTPGILPRSASRMTTAGSQRGRYVSDAQASYVTAAEDILPRDRLSRDAFTATPRRSQVPSARPSSRQADWDTSRSSIGSPMHPRNGSDSLVPRSSSRMSMAGIRVGIDGLPSLSGHPRGLSSDLTPNTLNRIRSLRQRGDDLTSRSRGTAGSSAVDELRSRFEGMGTITPSMTPARSASVIEPATSARQTRARTSMATAANDHRKILAPLTEPRRSTIYQSDKMSRSSSSTTADTRPMTLPDRDAVPRRVAASATPDVLASRSIRANTHTPSVSTSSAADMTPHQRNLQVAFDIFERHFAPAGKSNGAFASPLSNGDTATTASSLVERAHQFVSTVSALNTGLREVAQYIIQQEIQAEVDRSGSSETTVMLKQLDAGLAHLLKHSDNQVRNLGDLFTAFTRMDKESKRDAFPHDFAPADSQRSISRAMYRGGDNGTVQGSPRRSPLVASSSPRRTLTDLQAESEPRRRTTLGHPSLRSWQREQATPPTPTSLRRENRDISSVKSSLTSSSGSRLGSARSSVHLRDTAERPDARSYTFDDDPARRSPTLSTQRHRYRDGSRVEDTDLQPGPATSDSQSSRLAHKTSNVTMRPSATTVRLSPRQAKISDPSVDTAIAVAIGRAATSEVDGYSVRDEYESDSPLGDPEYVVQHSPVFAPPEAETSPAPPPRPPRAEKRNSMAYPSPGQTLLYQAVSQPTANFDSRSQDAALSKAGSSVGTDAASALRASLSLGRASARGATNMGGDDSDE